MPNVDKKILITDTSVLINFLNTDQINLLSQYPGLFFITEHVADEITKAYPEQMNLLNSAITNEIITVVSVSEEVELEIFSRLLKEHRLGQGECSAIACAINRKYHLAIDDKAAIKKAIKENPDLIIINTQDIMTTLIKEKVLTVTDADQIKMKWENEFRFMLKIKSFSEVL